MLTLLRLDFVYRRRVVGGKLSIQSARRQKGSGRSSEAELEAPRRGLLNPAEYMGSMEHFQQRRSVLRSLFLAKGQLRTGSHHPQQTGGNLPGPWAR